MTRNKYNVVLDTFGFVVFLLLAFSGLVLKYVVECKGGQGYRGGRGVFTEPETFLWLERSGWQDIHFVLSVTLILIVLLHIILHWNWIVCQVKSVGKSLRGSDK